MKEMYIRKSTIDDLDKILEIYSDAREFMRVSGNPNQWKDEYPLKSLVLQDIYESNSYVCIKDELILGTFYYEEGEDPTYKEIFEGQWINDDTYGVIHRIAVGKGSKGVGSFCLDWCFGKLENIRIDTHRDNIPMQRLLIKNGFKQCGIIYVKDGSERIAFQKTSYGGKNDK